MKILFVCTGNTCRSPLTVAAWQSLAEKPKADVSSAGLTAHSGARATPHAIEIAQNWNVDLAPHRARRLDEELVRSSDLICIMEAGMADVLRAEFPAFAAKIRTLGEFAPTSEKARREIERLAQLLDVAPGALQVQDIDDPFGGSLEEYVACAAQIRRAVSGLAATLSSGEMKS